MTQRILHRDGRTYALRSSSGNEIPLSGRMHNLGTRDAVCLCCNKNKQMPVGQRVCDACHDNYDTSRTPSARVVGREL